MWPYASRGSRFLGDVSEISPSALEAEDFSTNAASIKLWLPEKLVAAIDHSTQPLRQVISSFRAVPRLLIPPASPSATQSPLALDTSAPHAGGTDRKSVV